MPVYTYRRSDGTTFDYKQSFGDEPLKVDPATGQPVVRVVHAAGVIFKGSGFYVNDSRSASKRSLNARRRAWQRRNVAAPTNRGRPSNLRPRQTERGCSTSDYRKRPPDDVGV
jgi:predicted nucleic acid-binding Zn ribbon protein